MKTEKNLISAIETDKEWQNKWDLNTKCLTKNMLSFIQKKHILLYIFAVIFSLLLLFFYSKIEVDEYKTTILVFGCAVLGLTLLTFFLETHSNKKYIFSTINSYNNDLISLYNSVLSLKEKQNLKANFDNTLSTYNLFYLKYHKYFSKECDISFQKGYVVIKSLEKYIKFKNVNAISKILDEYLNDNFVLDNYMKLKEKGKL